MREVGCVSLKPYVVKLKDEKSHLHAAIRRTLVDQAGELQLEYAEKCEALGHRFRQEGYEKRAKYEFDEATQARRIASNLP